MVGVVTAAVVTMAGTALAGNGVGAVFDLGVKNSAKATTALTSKTSERVLAATGNGGHVEFPVSNPFKVCTIAGFDTVWASPEDGGSVYLLASTDIYAGKTTIAKGGKRYLATDMDALTGTSSIMTVDMLWAGEKTATQWRWVGVNGDGHPMVWASSSS